MLDPSISRIMSRPVVTVTPDTDLATAARRMLDESVGSLAVVDESGALVGILSDSDFIARDAPIPFSTFRWPRVFGHWLGQEGLEGIYREARRWTVGRVMSRPACVATEATSLDEVVSVMLERRIKHVPVVEDGRLVGMITRHDLLKLVSAPCE